MGPPKEEQVHSVLETIFAADSKVYQTRARSTARILPTIYAPKVSIP